MGSSASRQRSAPDWPRRFADLAAATTIPPLARFYAGGVVPPGTALAEASFVALDLETTGLDVEQCAIVSIGLVPFTLTRIKVAGSRYWVVRPRRSLAPESVLIHRITHEELDAAPRFSAILPDLLDALAGRLVVVHYRQIERPFLDQVCRRWMGEGLEFPLIDTMVLEAWALRRKRNWAERIAAGLGWRRRRSLRLAACRERYGLPGYTAHHAHIDALATAELFQAQVAHHLDRETRVDRLWL